MRKQGTCRQLRAKMYESVTVFKLEKVKGWLWSSCSSFISSVLVLHVGVSLNLEAGAESKNRNLSSGALLRAFHYFLFLFTSHLLQLLKKLKVLTMLKLFALETCRSPTPLCWTASCKSFNLPFAVSSHCVSCRQPCTHAFTFVPIEVSVNLQSQIYQRSADSDRWTDQVVLCLYELKMQLNILHPNVLILMSVSSSTGLVININIISI